MYYNALLCTFYNELLCMQYDIIYYKILQCSTLCLITSFCIQEKCKMEHDISIQYNQYLYKVSMSVGGIQKGGSTHSKGHPLIQKNMATL